MNLPWENRTSEEPCWCESGKTYAECHQQIDLEDSPEVVQQRERWIAAKHKRSLDHLYKYTSTKYLKEILLDDKLYFSTPSQFNDPFECRIRSDVTGTRVEKRRAFFRKAQIQHQLSDEDALRVADEYVSDPANLSDDYWSLEDAELIEQARSGTFRIHCLSRVPNDLLMWAHYAVSHQGVCLEFLNEGMFGDAWEVRYTRSYPRVNFFRSSTFSQMQAFVLTKSIHWKYECEFRMVRIRNPRTSSGKPLEEKYDFEPKLLSGIILGAQMSDEEGQTVLDLVSGRTEPITVYRAELKPKSFGIRIKPVRNQ